MQVEVEIVQWPTVPGRRPICADSGTAGGFRGETATHYTDNALLNAQYMLSWA
jgi:hypothetical protein